MVAPIVSAPARTFLLGAALTGFLCASSSARAAWEVTELAPEPRYALTKDGADIAQLTDGILVDFPSWTKRESVGWRDASFVQLSLSNPEYGGCQRLKIAVHAGFKPRAGVLLPRRIDVYGGRSHTALIHQATISPPAENTLAPGTIVLETAQPIAATELVLGIHTSGRFAMIDEIAVTPVGNCESIPVPAVALAADAVRSDSTARLKSAIRAADVTGAGTGPDELMMVPREPFEPLKQGAMTSTGEVVSTRLLAVGRLGASGMLEVLGSCESEITLEHTIEPDNAIGLEFAQVEPVDTFTANVVYDALRPLKNKLLKCDDTGRRLLWFDAAFEPDAGERAKVRFLVDDGADRATLDYSIVDAEKRFGDTRLCVPRALTWGYSIDLPIWKNRRRVLNRMIESGINVHVLPPRLLPPLITGQTPGRAAIYEAVKEMKLALRANPDVVFLLFARFIDYLEKSGGPTPTTLGYLANWTEAVQSQLLAAGLTNNQWYLYAFDEPIEDDIDLAIEVARFLNASAPQVRLYANPGDTKSRKLSRGQIEGIVTSHDMLQPSRRLAVRARERFDDEQWWFYDNPVAPAKDAPPFFYRALGVRAWHLGADGFGFWSFSDTSGTSAWDDFDGRRPDWAVVYEDKAGFMSSRRWEGFRQGIRDYRFLCRRGEDRDWAKSDWSEARLGRVMDTMIADALSTRTGTGER